MFGFMQTGYRMQPRHFRHFALMLQPLQVFYPFTLMLHAAPGLFGRRALKRHILLTS